MLTAKCALRLVSPSSTELDPKLNPEELHVYRENDILIEYRNKEITTKARLILDKIL